MVLLRVLDLLGRESFFPVDCRPRGRGVTAPQELLILRLMTTAAVGGRHVLRNHETVMFDVGLILRGLMALQAANALGGVGAHLVFVNDRVMPRDVTLRALP